jgi:Leucine-rich repeat (LRR) protein
MLQDNNLIGSLPSTWYLRNLYYLDLGNNQITGSVPSEWTGQMGLLRILYLDRNRLTGQLPARLGDIGNGRLILLSIHSNALTGTFPTFYNYTKKLIVVEIENNGFTGMDKDMCKHSVYESGELVRLTADCGVCPCKNLCSADMCNDGNDNDTKRKLF